MWETLCGERENAGPSWSLRNPHEIAQKKGSSGLREPHTEAARKKFPVPSFCCLPSLLLRSWLGSSCSLD